MEAHIPTHTPPPVQSRAEIMTVTVRLHTVDNLQLDTPRIRIPMLVNV